MTEGTIETTTADFGTPRVDVEVSALEKAFNEWMRRYIEEPERFEAEFRSVIAFKDAQESCEEPDYGRNCTAYLLQLVSELETTTG